MRLPILVNVEEMEKILIFWVSYSQFWLAAPWGLFKSVVIFLDNSPSYAGFSEICQIGF